MKLQQKQQQYDSSLNNKIPWTKNHTQKCGFKDRTSNSGFGLQFYSCYKYNPNANLLGSCTEIQSLHHTPPVATLNSLKKLQAGTEAEHLLIKQYSRQIQKTWFYLCSVKLPVFPHMASNYLSSSNYLNCN